MTDFAEFVTDPIGRLDHFACESALALINQVHGEYSALLDQFMAPCSLPNRDQD